MTPSPQQDQALKAVAAWHSDPSAKQVFYLAGYAGTGKTTIAKQFAASAKNPVFCAFTGKAALVMHRKGCIGARTIHSLIYCCKVENGRRTFELNPESAVKDADLVIVDECSMVGPELGRDLESFGRKILVIGDPAQLPPVDGAGYFTSREPDFLLTEIHRQAAESPVIRMSMDVREGRQLRIGSYGASKVVSLSAVDYEAVCAADQVLVGMNRTRYLTNKRVRELRGRPVEVSPGDKLICLRNNYGKGLLNGGMWRADRIWLRSPLVKMTVNPMDGIDDQPVDVRVNPLFFEGRESELSWRDRESTDEFAFGEAITVHKSQGSQWGSVFVFDESQAFREDAQRHLYTALTRAAERVTVAMVVSGPPKQMKVRR